MVPQGQLYYTVDDGPCIFVTSCAQTRFGHFVGRLLSKISVGDLNSGIPAQFIRIVYLIPPAVKSSGDRVCMMGHLSSIFDPFFFFLPEIRPPQCAL